jgi:hypothetical protein
MPQLATIYRIFVASPSDCVQERKLVPEVIHSWNAAHSLHNAAILEPVLWEKHSRPEFGDRPQAIINKQLVENCDILIGTFWTRLGTATGAAVSGTAEEIEEFRRSGKRVLLYFSSAPLPPENLQIDQYRALTEYKATLGDKGLYFQYDSVSNLRELLQRHLAVTMAEIHKSAPIPAKHSAANDEQVFLDTAWSILSRFERLKGKCEEGTQNDPAGIALCEEINQLAWRLREIVQRLTLYEKNKTALSAKGVERAKIVYEAVAQFVNQKGGSLEHLASVITDLSNELR